MVVGLPVPYVSPAARPLPESMDHFLCGDVAPILVDVPLIAALIDHDRLPVEPAPLIHLGQVR